MRSLDLSVIDQAFGDYADLYSDILRVSVVATPEQIQLAYFDRRSELFTLLAKMDSKPQDDATLSQRVEAESKMDAVVLAVRILGDPDQRLQYDRIRQERLLNRRRSQHGHLPGHNAKVGSSLDASGDDHFPPSGKPPRAEKKKSSKKDKKKRRSGMDHDEDSYVSSHQTPASDRPTPVVTPTKEAQDTDVDMTDDDDTRIDARHMSMDTDEMRQDDGDTTYFTLTSTDQPSGKSSGYLSCITNSRILRKISDEISGACEDTLVSVDQVFNAFTLTEKDIRAVTKRIDKAKKQLDG